MNEFVRAEQERRKQRGNAQSWYERVIPDLTQEQRDALDEALSDVSISARTIATVLDRWGFEVKEHTIGTWRRLRGLR